MDKRKVMVLLIAASMLAGCAEIIPDPPDNTVAPNAPDLEYVNGTYTVLYGVNNSTTPIVSIGNNSTWLEIQSINLNATHLSFVVNDNTVIFHNYSFGLKGYLNQSGDLWSDGYAPNMGKATLHTPDYPYDITVDYSIVYREWSGKE